MEIPGVTCLIDRRKSIVALGAIALQAPLSVLAQTPGRIPQIGYLVLSQLVQPPSAERAAFLQGLHELGYVDGKSIRIQYRSAEGEADFLPTLATELVQLKVDLIFVTGIEAVRAAMAATKAIPIVMVVGSNPVSAGLVKNLAQPGGNATGLTLAADDLTAKRLEMLAELLPRAKRVAVLRTPRNAAAELDWQELQKSAVRLNLTLLPFELERPDAVPKLLELIAQARPDALLLLMEPRMVTYSAIIADFAASRRIPALAAWQRFTELGGVLSYATNLPDVFLRAAGYVDKILKGAKPAQLPIEQPAKFELAINMKTARALGITIPKNVLLQVTKVIE